MRIIRLAFLLLLVRPCFSQTLHRSLEESSCHEWFKDAGIEPRTYISALSETAEILNMSSDELHENLVTAFESRGANPVDLLFQMKAELQLDGSPTTCNSEVHTDATLVELDNVLAQWLEVRTVLLILTTKRALFKLPPTRMTK